MYADQTIPRGFKRPAKDRLGARFSGSPVSGIDVQDPIKRQRQDIINWNSSFHGENRHDTGNNVHKDLKTIDLKKDVLKSSNKIYSATEFHKAIGTAGAATNVCPGGLKARPAIELISAKKPAVQSPSELKATKEIHMAKELTVSTFLQNLGLSKYCLTFQAEEVDMFALKHMSDADLKSIGLPMGPRKKILLAVAAAATATATAKD